MWQRRRMWPVFPCVLCVVLTLVVVCQRIELWQTQRDLADMRQQQEEAVRQAEMRHHEAMFFYEAFVHRRDSEEIDKEQLRQVQRSVLEMSHLLHGGQGDGPGEPAGSP